MQKHRHTNIGTYAKTHMFIIKAHMYTHMQICSYRDRHAADIHEHTGTCICTHWPSTHSGIHKIGCDLKD